MVSGKSPIDAVRFRNLHDNRCFFLFLFKFFIRFLFLVSPFVRMGNQGVAHLSGGRISKAVNAPQIQHCPQGCNSPAHRHKSKSPNTMTAIYLAIGIIALYRIMRKAKAYEANHPEQFTESNDTSNPAQL